MKKFALLAVGTALAAASLTACSSSSSSSTSDATTSAAASASASATGYTAEIENTFVTNCVKGASEGNPSADQAQLTQTCGCAYRGVVAQIPFADFAAADQAAAAGQSPSPQLSAQLSSISQACVNNPNAF